MPPQRKHLLRLGISVETGLKKTVALGADGAAVNLGSKGGVIALLQKDAGDFIIPFHCMPHRQASDLYLTPQCTLHAFVYFLIKRYLYVN